MKWLAFCLLVYAVVANNIGNPEVKTDNQENAPSPEASNANTPIEGVVAGTKKALNFDKLEGKLVPKVARKLTFEETLSGQGGPAICGQKATINYRNIPNNPLADASSLQTTTFTIGDGSTPNYLEEGIVGMAKGGNRIIHTPENGDIEAELTDISPTLPDLAAYRILGNISEAGKIYKCGAVAKLNISIWSVEGKKLFDSKEKSESPITFTIGKSEVFFGLEAGALGMSVPSQRSLIVPPALQNTLKGNKPAIDFPLPKNKTVIVDIESAP